MREQGIRAILGDEPHPDWLIQQLADETDAEVVARELEGFAVVPFLSSIAVQTDRT